MLDILTNTRRPQYYQAIVLMLLSSIFVALAALFGKWLALSVALPVLIFFRFLFPAVLLWWVVFVTKVPTFNKRGVWLNLLRAVFVVLSQYAFFYYLIQGSMLNATLLFLTSPLFVPLISRFLQKTPIHWHQWTSIVIGFVGVVCILHPSQDVFEWPMLVGLFSGVCNAFSQITYHKISKQTDTHTATLMMYSFAALLTFMPTLFYWHSIALLLAPAHLHANLGLFLLLVVFAMVAISNQALRGRAYSKVNKALSLTPFMYTAIVFSGLLDWWVFHSRPDLISIVGTALVFTSGIILCIVKVKPKEVSV